MAETLLVNFSSKNYLYSPRDTKKINKASYHPFKAYSPKQRQNIFLLKTKEHLGAKKTKRTLALPSGSIIIRRFLKHKGLVAKQTNFTRPLFQNGKAMRPSNTKSLGYLQMDTKHVTPELSGLPFKCYEYAAIDIVSRFKLAVILPDITDEPATLALQYFIKWFPFKITYI